MKTEGDTRRTWVKPTLTRKPVSATLLAPEAIIAQMIGPNVLQS
jgi:hypothetical protein